MALSIVGIDKIVIAQNKIDLVSREEAIEHYKQIKKFVKGTIAEDSPIVPISAQQSANMDVLIQCIEKTIPTPQRSSDGTARMHIARSFDINKPGTPIRDLKGGVIGGSLVKGRLKEGDKLEIRPGRTVTTGGQVKWIPIGTEITSIIVGGERVNEVTPGGLVGIGTKLDPSMTKEDSLVGQCAGKLDSLPPTWDRLTIEFQLFERAVGVTKVVEVPAIKVSENVMLSAGTTITTGEVKRVTRKTIDVKLSRPICADKGSRVAIGRKIRGRWHLIGAGVIL
jgi:translation initiation factor 2 subunit 3